MTIYKKTKTSINEVLKMLIIEPKYVEIIGNNIHKRYIFDTNKEYLQGYYERKITFVKNMNYNKDTKILKIFI